MGIALGQNEFVTHFVLSFMKGNTRTGDHTQNGPTRLQEAGFFLVLKVYWLNIVYLPPVIATWEL